MDNMNKVNKQMKRLDKGKTKSLGFIEKSVMKHLGADDGRKGLLRCNEDGIWKSSTLKEQTDAYEEFCASQMGKLKLEEEAEFKKVNTLFDKVSSLKKKLSDAKEKLNNVMNGEADLSARKEGEENLTDMQIVIRRTREREKLLQPLKDEVANYEKELSDSIETIFTILSHINERFDSTKKITNRLLQHSQRKIDVYWRAAMRHIPDLPAVSNVTFNNHAEQAFAEHYSKVVKRAEKLRNELDTEWGVM